MIYSLVRILATLILRPLYRPRAWGADRMPSSGPVIVVSNHQAWFDPFLLMLFFPRQMRVMAKKNLFIPIFKHFVRWYGAFPVDRDGNDIQAVRTSLSILKNGEVLLIYPEGTRTHTGEIGPLHDGAAMFAIKTGTPVVPIYVSPIRIFHRTEIFVGDPFDFSDFGRKADSAKLSEGSERIREKLLEAPKAYVQEPKLRYLQGK